MKNEKDVLLNEAVHILSDEVGLRQPLVVARAKRRALPMVGAKQASAAPSEQVR